MSALTPHQIALSHTIDDAELQRTRSLRCVDGQISLLDDALAALRAGDTDVTDEYLGRVIDALTAERTALRAPTPVYTQGDLS